MINNEIKKKSYTNLLKLPKMLKKESCKKKKINKKTKLL